MIAIIDLLKNIFAFAGYLSDDSGRFPPKLNDEDEKMFIEAWEKGDISARDKLIEHNLRLVVHIAKKYAKGRDTDDLISIGSIGLIKGVNTFETGKGRLSPYLSKCVENEILMHLRSTKRQQSEVSLSLSVGEDKDGNSISLLDILAADSLTDETVELKLLSEKLLYAVNNSLSERERDIISSRYGLFGRECETQKSISKRLKISRSYVSRIEKKALEKLFDAMEK